MEFLSGLTADQDLKEPEKLSEAQSLFLDCLLHTLTKNRGKDKATKTFTKLVEFMTEVRYGIYERKKRLDAQPYTVSSEVLKCSLVAGEVFGYPRRYIQDLGEDLTMLTLD